MTHLYRNTIILLSTVLLSSCSSHNSKSAIADGQPESTTVSAADTSHVEEVRIKMTKSGGVYEVPCKVNGVDMNFIFDTGASSVCISLTEAAFLLKNGYLEEDDVEGTSRAQVADGRIVSNIDLNLKSIEIGSIKLRDVKATVTESLDAPLLLGQSAIGKLGKYQIEGDELVLFHESSGPGVNVASGISNSMQKSPEKRAFSLKRNQKRYYELISEADGLKKDMIELAIQKCKEAKDMKPKKWEAYVVLGNLYSRENRYEEAIKCFSVAKEKMSNTDTLLLNGRSSLSYIDMLGEYSWCLAQERPKEAIIQAQEGLLLDNENRLFHRALYYSYMKLLEFDKAEKWAKALCDIHKHDGYASLAGLYFVMGRKDEAIRYCNKCLEINPDNVGVLLLLSEVVDYRAEKIELKRKAAKLGNSASQTWLRDNGYSW